MSNLPSRSPDPDEIHELKKTPPSAGLSFHGQSPVSHNSGQRGFDSASNQYAPLPHRSRSRTPTGRAMGADSLYSTTTSLNMYKTMDADTQALVDRRAGELAKWHIHWITPALIAALFVAGVIGAMGHHAFYMHLDGKPAEDQLKMIRYGTALAFFVKSTLVGTVIMCYRQRIWHTFRTRALTINGIDGLFSATEDPSQFFYNWEMIRNGKLATIMAACSW
jgi:hypothetical protein